MEALIGIMPFGNEAEHRYTPRAFRKLEEKYQAVFVLKALSVQDRVDIKKGMASATDSSTQKTFNILRKYIAGWEKIVDASSGDDYVYESEQEGGCVRKLWQLIPDAIKFDLLQEVMLISGLLDKEKLALD